MENGVKEKAYMALYARVREAITGGIYRWGGKLPSKRHGGAVWRECHHRGACVCASCGRRVCRTAGTERLLYHL